MDKSAVTTKLQDLQVQIKFIKQAVSDQPDLDIDEKNWAKVMPLAKKTRKTLFKEKYGKK